MNSAKLKTALVESNFSQRKLAKSIEMSVNTLNAKINGKSPITIDEAVILGKKLNLSKERFDEIFLEKSS